MEQPYTRRRHQDEKEQEQEQEQEQEDTNLEILLTKAVKVLVSWLELSTGAVRFRQCLLSSRCAVYEPLPRVL